MTIDEDSHNKTVDKIAQKNRVDKACRGDTADIYYPSGDRCGRDTQQDEIRILKGIKLLDIYKTYNQYLRQNRLMDYDDQMKMAEKSNLYKKVGKRIEENRKFLGYSQEYVAETLDI
ncbi:MAG: hypothetical protein K6G27_15610 [Lachnospiraceae bacterium]|nr:hypothetical protein [Lachnospiraceae bacterium]